MRSTASDGTIFRERNLQQWRPFWWAMKGTSQPLTQIYELKINILKKNFHLLLKKIERK
jgi:hypothetical protein